MKNLKNGIIILIGLLIINCNLVKAGELKIHAIECDVQGDSTLLESNGKYLLMDTCIKQEGNKVLEYLNEKKVTNFDIYISHYHGDHYGLIMDILNDSKYTIKNIYLPEYNKSNSLINNINKIAEQKNINVIFLKKGSEFNFEDAKFNILGPLEDIEQNSSYPNNMSLIAKIKVDNTTFLTAGDIEKEQEDLILKSKVDLKADIMKLSHHGGYTSNTEEFMKAVNPTYAFYHYYVDAEKQNFASDNWTKDTIARINESVNVLSTGYNGNIVYDIKDDEITITPTRNYLTATINYINIDDNKLIKSTKVPFVKNTKFHYLINDLPNYMYFADDNVSGTKYTENPTINIYYTQASNNLYSSSNQNINTLAAPNENSDETKNEDTIDSNTNNELYICTENNGQYYDSEGNIVTKEVYYSECGIVENPKTGINLPIIILITLLTFGCYLLKKVNKTLKKNAI